jgi:glycosyltransferase involved in cell wall biosynthesis
MLSEPELERGDEWERSLPAKPDTGRRLQVAIVDEELCYPPNSGKRIRTLNLLRPLARRHDITYLAYRGENAMETREAADYLLAQGIRPVLVDRVLPAKAGPEFYARLMLNLLSPLPYSVQVHNSRSLRNAIRRVAREQTIDLWQCEWTPYGESLARAVPGPWVTMAHNVESVIWRRYGEHEANPIKRGYIEVQRRKFERFERRMFALADRTITVSPPDAHIAAEEFGARQVAIVANGVDLNHFRPNAAPRDPYRAMFLGSLDWRPNLDAVRLLLERIFPAVLAQESRAKLLLVGRKPPAWLSQRVRGCPGVDLVADVPDVRPHLDRCGMMVVPLRIGGGSRLKIIEALATECPVVSSKVGAEGLELAAGRHYTEANSVAEMSAAILDAMRRPEHHRVLARQGRKIVVRCYDWSMLALQLEAIWREHAGGGPDGA